MGNHTKLESGDSISLNRTQRLRVETRNQSLGAFSVYYQYALDLAARRAPYAAATLARLLARVEQENILYFHLSSGAAELGLPLPTLRDHFEQLRHVGIIVPDPREERKKRGVVLWRICPYLAWRGTQEAKVKYINSLSKAHPFHDYAEPESE
jgi:hypothetical protein